MRISDWSSDVCSSDRQHLVADLGGRLVEADREAAGGRAVLLREVGGERVRVFVEQEVHPALAVDRDRPGLVAQRSEEHTSELQSLMRISYAVFCLKKKKKVRQNIYDHYSTAYPIDIK